MNSIAEVSGAVFIILQYIFNTYSSMRTSSYYIDNNVKFIEVCADVQIFIVFIRLKLVQLHTELILLEPHVDEDMKL